MTLIPTTQQFSRRINQQQIYDTTAQDQQQQRLQGPTPLRQKEEKPWSIGRVIGHNEHKLEQQSPHLVSHPVILWDTKVPMGHASENVYTIEQQQ
jgi:hypothetical protein